MVSSIAALKAQFDLQTRLYCNALEGISDTESAARGSEHINNIKWIAGHLLDTRVGSMARLAGLTPDGSYASQFGRGVPLDLTATYPPVEDLVARWKESATAIGEGLTRIPEEVLAAPSNAQVPIADESIRGLIAFLVSHESYHIGQIALLRKMVGKEAMSFK
jgi:uncharacterized damage-inducible protein DinB